MTYCIAKTKEGKDCTAQAMQGADYCYRHNPEIPEADKKEASVAGGRKRQVLANADPISLRNIGGIVSLLEENTNAVRSGQLDPRVNNAVVQNINALLKVYELAIVDSRVRKLEEKAGIDSPAELIDMGGK